MTSKPEMTEADVAEIADRLDRIAEIGREIAALSEESRTLRKEMVAFHAALPKMNDDSGVALVVHAARLAKLKPVVNDADKVTEITVTFDDVFYTGR